MTEFSLPDFDIHAKYYGKFNTVTFQIARELAVFWRADKVKLRELIHALTLMESKL